jgi:hypothetical protein
VIGIFASVDYGVSFIGLTALLMMLNSCANGLRGGLAHPSLNGGSNFFEGRMMENELPAQLADLPWLQVRALRLP